MRYERCIAYFLLSICRINAKAYAMESFGVCCLAVGRQILQGELLMRGWITIGFEQMVSCCLGFFESLGDGDMIHLDMTKSLT